MKIDENSIDEYWQRKSSYLLNDLKNFNEIFRKNLTYDNIKSHTKNSVSLSLWKIHFWENHKDRVKLTAPKSFRIKNRKFLRAVTFRNTYFFGGGIV